MRVRYSYLEKQFEDCENLWTDLRSFVSTGDFTLGKPLAVFESEFAELIGTQFAIGVNSGTDAIKLSLKALGVGYGDEVITAANTFVATVGAIAELGATPVFVDCDDSFCMNVNMLEDAITEKTRALVPVHFSGYMTDMRKVIGLAEKYELPIVEDACQAILASIDGYNAGTWGQTGAFSLHPLKNINVWSDGGVIVTNSSDLCENLKLLRNHGLSDRNTVELLGYNSRLDTLQAVVGSWLLPQAENITQKRIYNAEYLDRHLSVLKKIRIPPRLPGFRNVYHLYIVFSEDRDNLLEYCLKMGVEAKIHYPVPIYRQPGLGSFQSESSRFPVTDDHAKTMISLPCHQYLMQGELDYMIQVIREFFGQN